MEAGNWESTVVLRKQWHDSNVSLRKINRMKKVYYYRDELESEEPRSWRSELSMSIWNSSACRWGWDCREGWSYQALGEKGREPRTDIQFSQHAVDNYVPSTMLYTGKTMVTKVWSLPWRSQLSHLWSGTYAKRKGNKETMEKPEETLKGSNSIISRKSKEEGS